MKVFAENLPEEGDATIPKRLVLALCEGAKEVSGKSGDFKITMIVSMLPKQVEKNLPDDLVKVDVKFVRTLLGPLLDKSELGMGCLDEFVKGLVGWFRVFLPPTGKINIRSDFVLSLVEKIRDSVPDPDVMLTMALQFVPTFVSETEEFTKMDVDGLKEFVGFL